MKNVSFDYTKIYELNLRRIRKFSKYKRKSKDLLPDLFLLILLGNMNERLNTMFHLMHNNIFDGVYPLQRTFFEMFIAYEAMLRSEEKEKYISFYIAKGNYETIFKWSKLISDDNEFSGLLESWEKEVIIREQGHQKQSIKEKTKKLKMSENKLWFELASGKSFKDLSIEFSRGEDYYFCYDEPSNWVHSQRIEKNIDSVTFDSKISSEYHLYIYIGLFRSVEMMYNSICDYAEYIGITKSGLLSKYYDKFSVFAAQLQIFIKNQLSSTALSDEETRELKELIKQELEKREPTEPSML